MITENIVFRSDFKKDLKHLAIDQNVSVSSMLIDEADYVLENDKNIDKIEFDSSESFTMRLDSDLKLRIKNFCYNHDIRIKDFWNGIAFRIIKNQD